MVGSGSATTSRRYRWGNSPVTGAGELKANIEYRILNIECRSGAESFDIRYSVFGIISWSMPSVGSTVARQSESCSGRYPEMALLRGEGCAPLMDFLAIDANRRRRLDPQAHAIALDGDHANTD